MKNLDRIINKYKINAGAASPIIMPGFKRTDLAKLFAELKFKVGAEVGVERGRYSLQIYQANPGVKLYCIDCWQVYSDCPDYSELYNGQRKLDRWYNQAKNLLTPYNCELIKKYSLDAVRDFELVSLDFVYIDANHSFDYVMSDIIEWSRRVRPGGIVSGHDYVAGSNSHKFKFDVIEATNVYANIHKIKPWFIFSGERSASWFWVKGNE